ncbi:MAG: hypothetical protein GC138_04305 [Gammaproteobacteria bacterium]|nr:hypothetical protein [Gammaproteobacteria bacterium]
MNVSPLGISSARLPVLPGRTIAVPDANAQGRKARAEAVPAERVYIGEYVAANKNPSFFSREEFFAAHQYGGAKSDGNRQSMVQAYIRNAGVVPSGDRSPGRIDYFA